MAGRCYFQILKITLILKSLYKGDRHDRQQVLSRVSSEEQQGSSDFGQSFTSVNYT